MVSDGRALLCSRGLLQHAGRHRDGSGILGRVRHGLGGVRSLLDAALLDRSLLHVPLLHGALLHGALLDRALHVPLLHGVLRDAPGRSRWRGLGLPGPRARRGDTDGASGVGHLRGGGLAIHGRLRRPLVFGDDGRGVDLGRCRMRSGGQRLLVAEWADRAVPVGQSPGRMGTHGVALVIPARFRADHEFHERPQVRLTDFDDVVALLPEGTGDGPVAVHRDVYQGDPEAEVLHVGNDLGEVLLGADNECVPQGTVACQGRQVAVDLALHPLAPARPHPAQPQLHTGKVCEGIVLGGPAAFHRRLVPVAAQQREPRPVPGHAPEELEQARVVPGNGLPVTSSVDSHRTISQYVARVHEQRAPIHATPSFRSTRDVTSAQPTS